MKWLAPVITVLFAGAASAQMPTCEDALENLRRRIDIHWGMLQACSNHEVLICDTRLTLPDQTVPGKDDYTIRGCEVSVVPEPAVAFGLAVGTLCLTLLPRRKQRDQRRVS